MAGPTKAPEGSTRAGSFHVVVTGDERYEVFKPKPLPPDPPLDIESLQDLADRANQALGRLDGITLLLPHPDQFLYTYVRKEAVLSAQIEGTQSSLSELLLFEHADAPGLPRPEIAEPLNYVRALHHGLSRIDEGFPLSNRLLREIHALLVEGARGTHQDPGRFRTSQNWIGGTRPGTARYVPPPPQDVPEAMSQLEKFLHGRPRSTPILIKAALSHAQFETIHPFLDGNGRLGRLLVTLLLSSEGVLSKPLLYLSLYLKRNRDEYYERLQRVRTRGEWEEWVEFFLQGVVEVANSAAETTRRLLALVESDRQRILEELGRAASSAGRLHELAVREVVFQIPEAARTLGSNEVTVGSAVRNLERLGIVAETTGKARNKRYVYSDYLNVLAEGTEP